MDKRTLLAFVLMFAVLVGWNMMFGPRPSDEAAEDAASGEAASVMSSETQTTTVPSAEPLSSTDQRTENEPGAQVDTPSPAESAGSGWSETSPDAAGPVVHVQSEHYDAEIDLVGGDLRSWKLRQFVTLDGAPVELVTDRSLQSSGQAAHALRILSPGLPLDLSHVRFEAGGDARATGDATTPFEIVMDESHPEARLELIARRADGTAFRLQYTFAHDSNAFDVRAVYQGVDPTLLPRLEISWPGGIANSEPDTTREYAEFKAFARVGDEIHKKKYGDLSKGDGSKGRVVYEGTVAWSGVMSKYFTALVRQSELRGGRVRFDGDHARRLQSFAVEFPLQGTEGPGLDYTVYLGPIDYEALESIDPDAVKLVDLGPTIFRPLARFTLWLLKFLHGVIPNYGLVIILLSAATKFLFYPLTKSSTHSMREMQLIQPEMQRIKEKHKDDQQKQSQAMFALYKQHGINPMAGCLPLLVQMPVFWALFTVLRKTIELRQANFALWIDDLSMPDVVFKLPFSLPVLGDNFCILPILMAAGMWLQTKISSTSTPQAGGAMAAQAKMMTTFMPIMMFVFFYNYPSGLVLYWLVNTLLTIGQTWRIHQTAPSSLKTNAETA